MRKHLNTVSEEDDKEEEVAFVKDGAPLKDARKKPMIETRQLRLEVFPKNKELVFVYF